MTGVRRVNRYIEAPYGWQDSAACLGYDTNSFFTPSGSVAGWVRDLCRSCPVRRECLDFAMAIEGDHLGHMARHGVYGGLSAQERGRLAGHMRRINDDFPLPRQENP
jgi:WhiB family redox-sensing transcriptional regulator